MYCGVVMVLLSNARCWLCTWIAASMARASVLQLLGAADCHTTSMACCIWLIKHKLQRNSQLVQLTGMADVHPGYMTPAQAAAGSTTLGL